MAIGVVTGANSGFFDYAQPASPSTFLITYLTTPNNPNYIFHVTVRAVVHMDATNAIDTAKGSIQITGVYGRQMMMDPAQKSNYSFKYIVGANTPVRGILFYTPATGVTNVRVRYSYGYVGLAAT